MPTRKPYQANDKDRGKLEVLLEMDVPLQQIAQKIGVSIPTLQKHYGDLIEATALRPGPKTFAPSEEQRKLVTGLAGVGLPQVEIAKSIGRSKGSLQTHFREELELGRIQANVKVVANLYKMATGPTNDEVQDGLPRRAARREHGQGRGSDRDQATARNCCHPAGHRARRCAGLATTHDRSDSSPGQQALERGRRRS